MWELDCEEGWVTKNWCFWTMVLEKTLESPLDCKEIQPVHSEGDQSWVFIGRNDTKAETPILWPPHAKSWLIGKDFEAERDWGQEEKGMTEDEMAGWHHRLNGPESEWTPGVGNGQGSLACCSSWGRKESDTTERLNWTESLRSAELSCSTYSFTYFSPAFLRYNWFMTLCQLKGYNVFIWYIYESQNDCHHRLVYIFYSLFNLRCNAWMERLDRFYTKERVERTWACHHPCWVWDIRGLSS